MSKNSNKVLILIQYLSPGGIEWMVAHLADGLNLKQVWQPLVLVYDDNGVAPIDTFFLNKKIPFLRLQKPKGFSFALVMKIFQLVRKENISVIHVHHLGALMMASLVKWMSLNSIRIVYTQHSFIHLARYPRYRWFEKFFSFFADEITVVSEQVKNEFKSYRISQRESILIPNASRFPAAMICDEDQAELYRAEFLASEPCLQKPDFKKKWILYLGRIHQGKGQDHALKVWEKLTPTTRAQTNLIFIGPASDSVFAEKLSLQIAQCMQSENIFVTGSTLQASRWMQLSNLFMSSSESEGWPMAVLEALGAGTPVLLSNIQGHQMYKAWGQFYDLQNPSDGSQKLETLLELQETSEKFTLFRRNLWVASQDLRDQFSIEQMVKNYESVYQG